MDAVEECPELNLKRLVLLGVDCRSGKSRLLNILAIQQDVGNALPAKLLKVLPEKLTDLALHTQIYDCFDYSPLIERTFDVEVLFHPYVFLEISCQDFHETTIYASVFTPDCLFAGKTIDTGAEGEFLPINPCELISVTKLRVRKEGDTTRCESEKHKIRVYSDAPAAVFFTLAGVKNGGNSYRVAITRHVLLLDSGYLGRRIGLLALNEGCNEIKAELCGYLLRLSSSLDIDWSKIDSFVTRIANDLHAVRGEKVRNKYKDFLAYMAWVEYGKPKASDFGTHKLDELQRKAGQQGNEKVQGMAAIKRVAHSVAVEIAKWVQLI